MLTLLALASLAPLVQASPGGDFEIAASLGLGAGTLPGGPSVGAVAVAGPDLRFYGSSDQPSTGPEARIERRDGNNQLLWRATVQRGSSILDVAGLAPTSDGGVIAAMTEIESPFSVVSNVVVVRYDGLGAVLWEAVIDPQASMTVPTSESVRAHCAAPDGADGIWIGGIRLGPGVGVVATLFHVDGAGAIQPDVRPFGFAASDVFDVEPLPGGDLLIAAGAPSGNFAARLDGSSNAVWSLDYGAIDPSLAAGQGRYLREFVVGESGAVYGNFSYFGEPGTRVVRIDPSSGVPLWIVDPVPVALGGRADGLAAFPGGGVLSVGYRNFGFATGGQDVLHGRSIAPDGLSISQQFDLAQFPGTGLRLRGVRTAGTSVLVHGSSRAEIYGEPVAQPIRTFANLVELRPNDAIGTPYCTPALTNSTGAFGAIQAFGSDLAAAGDVVLLARRLPADQFGLFVSGSERGTTPLLGGSAGVLCIEGNLGRFSASLGTTGRAGVLRHRIDPAAIPTAQGPIAATAGLTWHFQCWHRDLSVVSTSNTTDAVTIVFQ